MPRQARLDAAGTLHHVLARGIARNPIVRDTLDRQELIKDLGELVMEADATCLAWCIMTNHLHLLIRTGRRPLSWIMHRLLLRHAQRFNRRWHRAGHVFQNRYKALLVDEDAYLLALIRYIHRNPLDAGTVPSLGALARYPWTGHSALMGLQTVPWQATAEVLAEFSRKPAEARRAYVVWMGDSRRSAEDREIERAATGRRIDIEDEVIPIRKPREERDRDERILGEGDFVATMLRDLEGRDRRKREMKSRWSPAEVIRRAADALGVDAARIQMRDRRKPVSAARAVACCWLVDELGMRGIEVAKLLGVSPPAVSVAAMRGHELILQRKLRLGDAK